MKALKPLVIPVFGQSQPVTKPYVPSLAMRLAQARAKEHQPPLKSLTSNAKPIIHYER